MAPAVAGCDARLVTPAVLQHGPRQIPSVAEQVPLAASAEIAMGIAGIDGFMGVCLLRTWSRASKQIMFRPAHRVQPALVSNGLHRAD